MTELPGSPASLTLNRAIELGWSNPAKWDTKRLPGPALAPWPEGKVFTRRPSALATAVKGLRYLRPRVHPMVRIQQLGLKGGR